MAKPLTYAQAKAHVASVASELRHPTKQSYAADPMTGQLHPRHEGKQPRYGRVVYFGDGKGVGILFEGRYLIAEGVDDEESIHALAHEIGATAFDPGVTVTEVSEEDFYAATLG